MRAQPAGRFADDFPWGAAVALIVLAVLLGGLARLGAEPLRLELYGEFERTPTQEIHSRLNEALQGGYFALDAQQVHSLLADLPWLAQVESEFLWPDRLALRLAEHRPLANLARGGVLTSTDVVIAVPPQPGLTEVTAPVHRYDEVAAVLRQVRAGCAGCRISSLNLRPGGQLSLQLHWPEGAVAVELGRTDWSAALQRLVRHALPNLRPQLQQVAAIDLRYRHGFAVRWQPEQEQDS